MKEVSEKWKRLLTIHKNLAEKLAEKHDEDTFIYYLKTGEELAVVYGDYRCQRCDATEHLQLHHLIQRSAKGFMDWPIYLIQRNYWANLTLLCDKCHALAENRVTNGDTKWMNLTIAKIRRKHKWQKN